MIKFYTLKDGGRLSSCVGLCLWLLEETGKKYELINIDLYNGEHKTDYFLKLNPNGKIPCLNDDGFLLWESIAINYYVTTKYKPELLGKNIQETALVYQWTQWVSSEIQNNVNEIYRNAMLPREQRNPAFVRNCKYKIMQGTAILDKELAGKKYLAGENFTLADINVAAIMSIHTVLHSELNMYPNFNKWLNNVLKRPAIQSLVDKKSIILT